MQSLWSARTKEDSDLFRGPGRYQLFQYAAWLSEHTRSRAVRVALSG